ncbi:hypothetical protein D3C80_1877000 [compost metagenome]
MVILHVAFAHKVFDVAQQYRNLFIGVIHRNAGLYAQEIHGRVADFEERLDTGCGERLRFKAHVSDSPSCASSKRRFACWIST